MRTHGRRAAGSRLAAMVLVLMAGCVIADGDDGAGDSDDASGPSDGTADEGGPTESDVPGTAYCASVSEWSDDARAFEVEVVDRVNSARARGATCGSQSFGAAGPLALEGRLRCAARVHSLDMASRGFFDHDNPDGESPFDRMERAGYSFAAAGENIAAGQTTPQEVVDGWLQSPGHCSNIMSPDFTQIGVGYVSAPGGPLPHYWTQTFGTPL